MAVLFEECTDVLVVLFESVRKVNLALLVVDIKPSGGVFGRSGGG